MGSAVMQVTGAKGARASAPAAVSPRALVWSRFRSSPRPPTSSADIAETVLRLAVLLQAGVAPARAWEHLARAGDPAARHVASAIDRGLPLPEAIATAGTGAWREVGVACQVALVVGSPLAECLRGLAAALRDAQEAADEVRVTLAEPAGTARLMSWLPLVAVGLGAALGFDTFGTLFANPLGLACLGAGAVLILAAHRWTKRLVRIAASPDRAPGLDAELMAIALSGGVSIDRARAVVRDARRVGTMGESTDPGGESGTAAADPGGDAPGGSDDVDAVLALSRTAGVPAVELLRASAAHARHRARVEARLRAARLSSRLLIPLGVCTLPAFLLLGVAPMLLSVMSTMSVSL
ncbi:tight adherence protein B [Microbacterium trichothecenolyticum]|uniref:type II secretion system F family protein n=1 Tax=Microbacterium trichothecenolyticum TaxID=69370 RepID=UPI002866B965|nr:type II secretion system F family protein [Microbacterium trichothecenolyticum]MDR7111271.1 tight adherence protein B [Microbacterium trichothecenolyticum]